MFEQFRVEQALFGYREGHNLMAASMPLSPRERHFLATVTDASGSRAAEGFDVTYTGLPVPETEYYAVFCTWSAPEMPRPGCVWSHVLFLNIADLARIPDLSVIPPLCKRPIVSSNFSQYEQQLTLVASEVGPRLASAKMEQHASILLEALYGHPDTGVVILDQQSTVWEDLVFAVWSQQWPRLRRNFAFSTGSLGDRRSAGVEFDLQVAPESSERLWQRIGSPTKLVDVSKEALRDLSLQWVHPAVDDLQIGSMGPLRRFLFSFGSDLQKPRHSFVRLVTAYERLFLNDNDWTEKLKAVAQAFPDPSDALRLKASLLTLTELSSPTDNLERAWTNVSFLFRTLEAQAYAKVSFDHTQVVPLLWKRKQLEVLSLVAHLVRQEESPAASAFAAAVAREVHPSELQLIASQNPELIQIFLHHRPALVFECSTWKLPAHIQWQIAEVLDSLQLNQESWGKVLTAMLLAETSVSVRDAVRRAGPCAMQAAFRWLESNAAQERLPPEHWREALAKPAAVRLSDPTLLQPGELALCGWLASSDAVKLISASRKDVQKLAAQSLEHLPQALKAHTAFLLVSLGLRAAGDEGANLLARGFFEVHDTLGRGLYAYSVESWRLLAPELPDLGLWRRWDRCEQLRKATRKWLLANKGYERLLYKIAITQEHRNLARKVLTCADEDYEDDGFID